MSIWQTCNGHQHIKKVVSEVHRACSNQSRLSMSLSDNLDDHNLLEGMVAKSRAISVTGHYLLRSPLPCDSRFGSKFDQPIIYTSESLNGFFTELAYHRFLFSASYASGGDRAVTTGYTSFSIRVVSEQSVDLTQGPFAAFSQDISSPDTYQRSTELGSNMRENGVSMFIFNSSRGDGRNIGFFDSTPFLTKPDKIRNWMCHHEGEAIVFYSQDAEDTFSFCLSDFLVDGVLPLKRNAR